MKIARFSADAQNLEWNEARTPASMRLSLRCLLAGSAMLISIPHGHALTCFASAEAVRQENPAAWPSWTMRAPGHEGDKCWYASTRAAAHDRPNPAIRRNPLIPRTEGIGAKEQFEQEVEVTGSRAPTEGVRAPSSASGSSFDDRFSAILDGSPTGAGSKFQQVIDLFGGGAHDP